MSGIFKAYDIRGAYPDELNEAAARRIGSAFAAYLGAKEIVVGRDMRLSSPALSAAFVEGARSAGADIVDVGMVTSPLLYYALIDGKYEGGAMVTASHLPAGQNGFKLNRRAAVPLSRDRGLPELEKMVREGGVPFSQARPGGYRTDSVLVKYVDRMSRFVRDPRPLRIVVDAGNGIVGPELTELFRRIPAWNVTALYMEPDGSFPHHVANPLLEENTKDLQNKVLEEKADIGVAFDGDADRCGFIDEKGKRIREDLVTAFIAENYLTKKPGERIIYDLRSSRIVSETIRNFGGVPIRSRVGHSFIKERMRQEDAAFAGELSGHYYYRDTGFTDNALFTMIQMLNFLARKKEPLSELLAPLRKYASTGEINFKTAAADRIEKALETTFRDGQQDHLDGLTVSFDPWWFNLRSSNTEPVIRLNLEATGPDLMNRKLEEVIGVIRTSDPDAIKIS